MKQNQKNQNIIKIESKYLFGVSMWLNKHN